MNGLDFHLIRDGVGFANGEPAETVGGLHFQNVCCDEEVLFEALRWDTFPMIMAGLTSCVTLWNAAIAITSKLSTSSMGSIWSTSNGCVLNPDADDSDEASRYGIKRTVGRCVWAVYDEYTAVRLSRTRA